MGHVLDDVNLTELLEMCEISGLWWVERTWSREDIYDALENGSEPRVTTMIRKRAAMEKHIRSNHRRLRTQLDCDGKCTTCMYPELFIHRHWLGFKDDML